MLKDNPIQTKVDTGRKRVADIDRDLERLDESRKREWDAIKDFRVSSNRADEGYDRIKKIVAEMKKLINEKAKLEKFIKENAAD